MKTSWISKHLFASFFLGSLGIFIFSLLVFGAIWMLTQKLLISFLASLSIFLIGILIWFNYTTRRPLQKVAREMKALLVQEPYHQVYTEKENEIGVIAHFFNEVTQSLNIISSRLKEYKRMTKELNAAQRIQQELLPRSIPEIPGLKVVAKTRPASEMGGDTFDFFPEKKRTLMYTGDSTGHGLPASMVMLMVDVLISTFISMGKDLIEVIHQLNTHLRPHIQNTMFMTLILLEWQHEEQKLRWVGAGHEHVIHFKSRERKCEAIPTGGVALGMIEDNLPHLHIKELHLEPNDFVILYSDGIVEAKNMTGENYGLVRLTQFLEEQLTLKSEPQEIFEAIVLHVNQFMEGHAQEDDMTVMVIKRLAADKDPAKTAETLHLELS